MTLLPRTRSTCGPVLAIVLIAFLMASSTDALAQSQRGELMMDDVIQLGDQAALVVDVADADVVVETTAVDDQREAHVRIFMYARNMDRAREYFRRQNFSIESSAGDAVVKTNRERRFTFNWGRDGGARITVVVAIPGDVDHQISTSDGDVALGATSGDVSIRTSDGDVRFADIVSESVQLRTSDGDIQGDAIEGSAVEIRTSDGDIRVARLLSEELSVVTSDGDIDVAEASGSGVEIRTSDGDISVGDLITSSARVHSSDGSISLDYVEGGLDVSTSDGDIAVQIPKSSAVDLRTSDGSIDVFVASTLAADLRVSGSRVRVSSSIAFDGDIEKRSAEGRINGGGKQIRARASDGEVTIRPIQR